MGYGLCQRMGFCGSVKMLSVKLAALRFQPDLVIWRNNCFSFQWAGQLGFVTRVFVTFEGRSSLAGSLASVACPNVWPSLPHCGLLAACFLKWLLKLFAWEEAQSHWLQWLVWIAWAVWPPPLWALPPSLWAACRHAHWAHWALWALWAPGTGHTQFGPSEQIHNTEWRGLPSLMDSTDFHVQLDPPKTMPTQNECVLNQTKMSFCNQRSLSPNSEHWTQPLRPVRLHFGPFEQKRTTEHFQCM